MNHRRWLGKISLGSLPLNDGKRVGDAVRPEDIPNAVDFVFVLASDHARLLSFRFGDNRDARCYYLPRRQLLVAQHCATAVGGQPVLISPCGCRRFPYGLHNGR